MMPPTSQIRQVILCLLLVSYTQPFFCLIEAFPVAYVARNVGHPLPRSILFIRSSRLSCYQGLMVSSRTVTPVSSSYFQAHHQYTCPRTSPCTYSSYRWTRKTPTMLKMSPNQSSDQTSWSEMTVPQLKSQLREWKLPVSGVKAELVRRLEEYQDNEMDTLQQQTVQEAQTLGSDRTPSNYGDIIVSSIDITKKNDTSKNIKSSHSYTLPPPKDETEIQVMKKEVQETVRMLERLKLGKTTNSNNISTTSTTLASSENSMNSLNVENGISTSPKTLEELQQQVQQVKQATPQEQQQIMMESLELSVRRYQQQLRKTQQSEQPQKAKKIYQAEIPQEKGASSISRSEMMQKQIKELQQRAANDLKAELTSLRLLNKGRKPDLVRRLAEYYVIQEFGEEEICDEESDHDEIIDRDDKKEVDVQDKADANTLRNAQASRKSPSVTSSPPSFEPKIEKESNLQTMSTSFAGIPQLSQTAANALHQAFGTHVDSKAPKSLKPTPIQSVAIPKLYFPPYQSALLHAPTGSGKTLAYLLPITEQLWREVEKENDVLTKSTKSKSGGDPNEISNGMALILLPTRELAAQVAGIATVLAPRGMVKLIPRPMNLMDAWKEERDRGETFEFEEMMLNAENEGDCVVGVKDAVDMNGRRDRIYQPRIIVGSAKSISYSLFGDGKMPGTPTSKPEGKKLLGCARWLVMDEVDRLLSVKKTRTDKKSKHEKPAALLAAAISRLTFGRIQVIAASATVGRPLRRELSRVLGLEMKECPEVLRGVDSDFERADSYQKDGGQSKHVGRAVKIPGTVTNYVLPVDGSTSGSLLTSAAFAVKSMLQSNESIEGPKLLFVLTRNCGIKVSDALGALRHFGIKPDPQSLLDALEAEGSDRLMEVHRRVSGVVGVGGSKQGNGKIITNNGGNVKTKDGGYFLVTHEDNVRGLHLDALDAVIVVGRPGSPDEYTHIAGRTGRAGRRGSVLNVVGFEQAAALTSWEQMLGVNFCPVDETEVGEVISA